MCYIYWLLEDYWGLGLGLRLGLGLGLWGWGWGWGWGFQNLLSRLFRLGLTRVIKVLDLPDGGEVGAVLELLGGLGPLLGTRFG